MNTHFKQSLHIAITAGPILLHDHGFLRELFVFVKFA